jgi:predicted nucleotidyltransferase
MNIHQIKEKIQSPEYSFLTENPNLGENIILLGLGGSHAYGTSNENSDLDIRGIATNSKRNILISNDFEQVVDVLTDTTIYSFDKIIDLFCSCNPNTIELLGLKPEHYLYISPVGKEILDNKKIFLSKKAVHTFGGYANAQLRRLENKSARLVSQSQMEQHILKSIEHASVDFKNRYFTMPEDAIKLYIDSAVQEGYDTEIFMDVVLSHYPLRDFKDLWSEMHAIVKSYSKIGKRNEKAIEHDKLGKHMMHLVRLYYMCFDILEYGEINTYREEEHDFLMSIRNGDYLDGNRQPIQKFYDIVDELETKLDYLKDHTNLPDNVDWELVNDFKASVNGRICK